MAKGRAGCQQRAKGMQRKTLEKLQLTSRREQGHHGSDDERPLGQQHIGQAASDQRRDQQHRNGRNLERGRHAAPGRYRLRSRQCEWNLPKWNLLKWNFAFCLSKWNLSFQQGRIPSPTFINFQGYSDKHQIATFEKILSFYQHRKGQDKEGPDNFVIYYLACFLMCSIACRLNSERLDRNCSAKSARTGWSSSGVLMRRTSSSKTVVRFGRRGEKLGNEKRQHQRKGTTAKRPFVGEKVGDRTHRVQPESTASSSPP